MAQAEARGDASLAWAAGAGWHPGVVGIVAARLKEATGLPSVVIGVSGGIGKGSARSVPGVDIGRAIQRLAAEGLIVRGGGHAMAAGLTVEAAGIPAAMARLLPKPAVYSVDLNRWLPVMQALEAVIPVLGEGFMRAVQAVAPVIARNTLLSSAVSKTTTREKSALPCVTA